MTDANAVAAPADEPSHDGVRRRIYLGERNADCGKPYETIPYADIAASRRNVGVDRCNHPIGLRVDARDGAVPLIEGPNTAFSDRKEARKLAYRDTLSNLASMRVDSSTLCAELVTQIAPAPAAAANEPDVVANFCTTRFS
jgi:hypothetical protein